jgi:hypothetical protein
MSNFTEAVEGAVKSGLCTYLQNVDKANRWLNSLSPSDLPNFAGYWRPKLCDDDPTPTPDGPSWSGGQCPGVQYQVNAFINASGITGPDGSNVSTIRPGPISDIVGGPLSGIDRGFRFGPNQEYFRLFRVAESAERQEASITSVVRVDGLPDNCGDAPISPFPPNGDTYNISPTYVNNEGDEVSLSGNVLLFAPVFAPVIAPVTTVIAPVRVNLGGITFDGTLQLAPDFNFQFGSPPADFSPGSPDGDDGPFPPADSPDTPDDAANSQLAGVFVRSELDVGDLRATAIFPENASAPTLYVPRIASLYFRVREGGRLGWLGPIDVKHVNSYHEVPPDVFAIDAIATPEPGVSVTVTGVRKLTIDSLT